MFCTNRRCKEGGGVALFIDKTIECKIVDHMSLAIDDVLECITVEIILQNRKNIFVSCVYRAPNTNIDTFKGWMMEMVNANSKKDVIICGDFNVNLLKENTHNY